MEQLINVFGGNGFVGSRYCELTEKKYALPQVVLPPPKHYSNLIKNDRDDYTVKPGTTDIVYFISTISNYNVHTDPFVDIDTNLITLMKVLESWKLSNPEATFNFISSWFVYGDVELPAKEYANCDPKGFYSITKRAAEQLLISYCETFDLKYRIIRLANVLGKSDKKVSKQKNALQWMINEIVQGNDINLYDGGQVYRDYIHVDDVVQSINLIIQNGDVDEIYNVGNGDEIYIGDVLNYVKYKTNSTSNLNNIEAAAFHKIVQSKNMVLDISRIQQLGYKPQFTMEQIIDSLI
ncbi:WcaG Nucleoside-diphosphate-sugar epimerases [uncultured Caudovirales phage]|uniref:WcaG Nucleoside-diphosphate-sugar epimerases n=1 Tax=uncultured Caudovirales phage TaxID=2100421 RepID=A0A6J5LIG7_9CAUD|nr:WcaG Nucleoside-diphosphate-sugar epimerases [uncultured Caudovirales phage]